MKKHIVVGLLALTILLSALPYAVIAEQTQSESYPTHGKLAEPDLFKYKAKLYLDGDEVWIKLTVKNRAEQGYMFLIGCKIPCIPSWGHPHLWIRLEPKEKFTWSYRVRPCEAGWKTNLVPVFISILPDDPFWRPWDIIYFGDFMLEIPEKWDFVATT